VKKPKKRRRGVSAEASRRWLAKHRKIRKVPMPGEIVHDVLVYYSGGPSRALDRALRKAARRGPDGSGCWIHTGERDLHWECKTLDLATQLLVAFARWANQAELGFKTKLRFEIRRTQTAWLPCSGCNRPVFDYIFNDEPPKRGVSMLCHRCAEVKHGPLKLRRRVRRRKKR